MATPPSKSVLVAKAKRPASAASASASAASASAPSRRLFTIPSSTQTQHQQQSQPGNGLPNLFEAERRNAARLQPPQPARPPTATTPFLDAFASMTSSDSYQAVVAAASTPATQQQPQPQPQRSKAQPTRKPSKLIEDSERTVLVSHQQVGTTAMRRHFLQPPVLIQFVQKGNRVLDYINNVPWKFADVLPDFVVGRHNCILFLR